MRLLLLIVSLSLVFLSCNESQSNNGDAFFNDGNFEAAIKAYNEYLSSNSADIKTIYNRGRAYEELEMYEQAELDYQTVLKTDVKNVNAMNSLSKISYNQANYEQAALWAKKAVETTPDNFQSQFLHGRAQHMLGFQDAAIESYTSAISINKNFGIAYLYRGAARVSLNKMRQACEDFKKAANLNVEGAEGAIQKYCN